jgi:drug/metabolite transporter (DMT)-like permease
MTFLPLILIGISTFMHAGWNLLAHSRRSDGVLFLRISLITATVGFIPALIAEINGPAFVGRIWGWLLLTGVCQATYYFGLTKGYQTGNFTIVYPLARALPVLALAFIDLLRGHAPSPLGWVGIGLVMLGCMTTPLDSLRHIELRAYSQRVMIWVIVTALGTIGYTTVDKITAEILPPGPGAAARYAIWEVIATLPFLWLALRLIGQRLSNKAGGASWRLAAVAASFIFGAYWLVLWSYQLSPYASYIVALRQLSIVIGVLAAATFLHERTPPLRIMSAATIAGGIICISLAAL